MKDPAVEYTIFYEYDGKQYSTRWCASTYEPAVAHFQMWHHGVKIIKKEIEGSK